MKFFCSSDTSLLAIIMLMTRSRNGSRNPYRGTSPMSSGNDDRSPSPPPRQSCVRMQKPSAASKKSAAKADSPPGGRTLTRSASRGASTQAAVYAWSDVDKVQSAAATQCSLSAT